MLHFGVRQAAVGVERDVNALSTRVGLGGMDGAERAGLACDDVVVAAAALGHVDDGSGEHICGGADSI
jgi:hypothetical protein